MSIAWQGKEEPYHSVSHWRKRLSAAQHRTENSATDREYEQLENFNQLCKVLAWLIGLPLLIALCCYHSCPLC